MKHSMVGLILFLTTASAWAGTLTDNFDAYEGESIDDGKIGDWRPYQGVGGGTAQWFVKEGELVSISENVCDVFDTDIIILGDQTWRNYEFEIQFKIVETLIVGCLNSAIGFGIRCDDTAGNLNDFGFFTDKNAARDGADWDSSFHEQWVQAQQTHFTTGNFMVKQDVWHTARIVADGDSYQYFIDDEQFFDFQDNGLDGGGVIIDGRNVEVHFDNLRVTGDDIPDTVTAVDPKAKLATTWATIKQGR